MTVWTGNLLGESRTTIFITIVVAPTSKPRTTAHLAAIPRNGTIWPAWCNTVRVSFPRSSWMALLVEHWLECSGGLSNSPQLPLRPDLGPDAAILSDAPAAGNLGVGRARSATDLLPDSATRKLALAGKVVLRGFEIPDRRVTIVGRADLGKQIRAPAKLLPRSPAHLPM